MAISAISEASFKLAELSGEVYELEITFSKGKEKISDKKFTFLKQSFVQEGEIFDIFTKNGECCTSLLSNLFKQQDLKEVEFAQKQMLHFNRRGAKVGVLDLKDPHTSYLPCIECDTSIQRCEEVVTAFFQGKQDDSFLSDETITLGKLFHEKPLDYLIYEGSLKSSLLMRGGFEEKEIEYFNQQGKVAFCQCAEFFMNSFKLGHYVKGPSGNEFHAEQFIETIAGSKRKFTPFQQSVVLYPSHYKKIYSPNGEFAKTLSPIFSVSGSYFKKTKITVLTVEGKK